MEQKTINRKHVSKKTTPRQEEIIETIKGAKSFNSWLEAKNEYFENQATYDRIHTTAEEVAQPTIAQEIASTTELPKRTKLTIAETKLGVTMVISKEDCKELGIDTNKTTKEAIKELRAKLGLKPKGGQK